MSCVQLDLFTGKPIAPVFEGAQAYDEPAKRAGIADMILNPCKACKLREFCSPDDCAQHLFDLDLKYPENEDFSEWLSE